METWDCSYHNTMFILPRRSPRRIYIAGNPLCQPPPSPIHTYRYHSLSTFTSYCHNNNYGICLPRGRRSSTCSPALVFRQVVPRVLDLVTHSQCQLKLAYFRTEWPSRFDMVATQFQHQEFWLKTNSHRDDSHALIAWYHSFQDRSNCLCRFSQSRHTMKRAHKHNTVSGAPDADVSTQDLCQTIFMTPRDTPGWWNDSINAM